MAVRWDDNLATGIKTIDNQHKEIFRRINALLEACKQGKGKETVGDTIDFLESYVVEHFRAEEGIQLKYDYPEYPGHKAMHERFIEDVQKLKEKFEKEGPTLTTVLETDRMVIDWLVKHIKKVDKALAEYLKAQGHTNV
jgi:hemerythrin